MRQYSWLIALVGLMLFGCNEYQVDDQNRADADSLLMPRGGQRDHFNEFVPLVIGAGFDWTPEALEAGKAKGVDNPQEADACLKCHVTGHGLPTEILGKKWRAKDGVTCESCHGFGADYRIPTTVSDYRPEGLYASLQTP